MVGRTKTGAAMEAEALAAAKKPLPLMTNDNQKPPTRLPAVHTVKSWTMLFQAVLDGRKGHDIRVLDRDYQVGDYLVLQEYDWGKQVYTGRHCQVEITYITSGRVGSHPGKERKCAFSPTCLHPDYGVFTIRLTGG